MDINDEKICELYTRDREKGFALLMKSYRLPVYEYARRLVVSHEDAEDVAQETLIRVYRSWDKFRQESSLRTWIYRIATNEAVRLLNGRRKEVVSADEVREELTEKLRSSDYVDYDDGVAVKFQEAILRLPEKQRLVFNLRYYDELEYEEIAGVLGGSAEAMKVNYHYAKQKIKEYILK